MPDSDTPDFADALPEYVAECDEHLTAARRVLLEIEPSPDRTPPEEHTAPLESPPSEAPVHES